MIPLSLLSFLSLTEVCFLVLSETVTDVESPAAFVYSSVGAQVTGVSMWSRRLLFELIFEAFDGLVSAPCPCVLF